MPATSEPPNPAEKLKALLQIQSAFGHSKRPKLIACGVSESMFRVLANEGLIVLQIDADEGTYMERHRVNKISELGFAILAQGLVSEPAPVRVFVEPLPESKCAKIFRVLGKKLWEVILVLLGVPVAIFVAWYLLKHHLTSH